MIEVFDLFKTEFIRSPIILVCPNNPIGRIRVITISIFQMILTYYNDKWRYYPAARIDILNYSKLFSIVKLYSFSFLTPMVRRYNKSRYNLAYKKAYLVEILNVGLYDTIFGNHILEKKKLNSNYL